MCELCNLFTKFCNTERKKELDLCIIGKVCSNLFANIFLKGNLNSVWWKEVFLR